MKYIEKLLILKGESLNNNTAVKTLQEANLMFEIASYVFCTLAAYFGYDNFVHHNNYIQ